MKNFQKLFVLYISIACLSGDHAYGITTLQCLDLGVKVAFLATLAGGLCINARILCDIRDILFEQLMVNAPTSTSDTQANNVTVSYLQLFDEHADQYQRDTHVQTSLSLSAPRESMNLDTFSEAYGDEDFYDDEFDAIE